MLKDQVRDLEDDREDSNISATKEGKTVVNLDKSKKKKSKKEKEEIKEKENDDEVRYPLLDILFSFISVQSEINTEDIKQNKLNLYTSRAKTSRATAGTRDFLPGSVNDPTFPHYK